MRSLLTVFLALALCTPGFAGQSAVVPPDEDTAIRRALVELENRRLEVAALKEVVKAKDEHVHSLEAIITSQAAIIEQWKTAATERGTANTIDAKIEASYRESVAKYEAELTRVRQERDSAKHQRWLFGFCGAVLGATLAILANRN